jgi:DNA polymerase elongation subunit (family B)
MHSFYTNVEVIGNTVHVREIINGSPNYRKIKYKPTLYVPAGKPTQFKTLSGNFLQPVDFEDISTAREWVQEFNQVDNFEFYGMNRFHYAALSDLFPIEHIEYDFNLLTTLFLDIETEAEHGFPNASNPKERVNLITIEDYKTQKYYVFGLEQAYTPKNASVEYRQFSNEKDLLLAFLVKWKELNPDIVTGWWVTGFDIPYLINRIDSLFEEGFARKYLSPYGKIRPTTFNFRGGMKDIPTFAIMGVAILDYQRIYAKFIPDSREDYKLDTICEVELKVGKLNHDEYETFADFYRNDWTKFVDYNIRDVSLVHQLEEKLSLIQLVLQVAYDGHCNYEDVLSQVRVWDCKIYNKLKLDGIQIPQLHPVSKKEKYKGAYVKIPKPGRYKWIISYDVASLYPNIIRTLNIGTETKMRKITKITEDVLLKNGLEFTAALRCAVDNVWTLAANGVCYSKDVQSFYSKLIEEMFNNRKFYQAEKSRLNKESVELEKIEGSSVKVRELKSLAQRFHIKQYAVKIQMNSLYGAIGNEFFRFYDIDNAEAVTITGQFIIKQIGTVLNNYLNKIFGTMNYDYIVYQDTDSCYISLDKLVADKTLSDDEAIKLLKKASEKNIEPLIDKILDEIITEYLNGVPGALSMKREVIAKSAIWTGKKRYMLWVLDDEDDSKVSAANPKLKANGVETKKSGIPKFCRERMAESIKLLFTSDDNNDTINKIVEVKKEFYSKIPNEISMPKSCNGLEKFGSDKSIFIKGTPQHVRGALMYNHLLSKGKLDKKYQKIKSGDKIRVLNLKLPNPSKQSVISFPGKLPIELGLDKYIDYELQFRKAFLEPLELILKAIKWTSEKKSSLTKFF